MNYQEMAQEIVDHLGLTYPPVALAFADEPPPGVETLSQEVPSACSLWRRAESATFYAKAESHHHCPVGTMTMGFELTPAVLADLQGMVGQMCDCGYLQADEPAGIPTVRERSKKGIVYGPLASFPTTPDLMLLWVTPLQAMFFNEGVGSSRWAGRKPTSLFGRPACGALPMALNEGGPTMSTGCMGMRTFTEIDEDRLLAVVPGQEIEAFCQEMGQAVTYNETMRALYEERKAQFAT